MRLTYADVVELVDTHALGACAFGREGSSPFIRTKEKLRLYVVVFLWYKVRLGSSRKFTASKF